MPAPTISLREPVEEVVDRVAAVLDGGGLVVLPTDTVYGIAARPGDPAAMAQLFELKGRPGSAPIAVLCATTGDALALAEASAGPAVAGVVERWWPGPLTLVLPRRPGVELHLGEPSATIGLRVPDHDLVRAVAARVGPVAATSANRHGEPAPVSADGLADEIRAGVDLVVDGGATGERASTVVDATDTAWRVLREGPIPGADVLALAPHS